MSVEPSESPRWWADPRGLVSAATIVAMILGFFYVREKAMWEMNARIAALELRGTTAITSAGQRLERVEQVISSIRDQVNFLERKIDRLERVAAEYDERRQKSYEAPVK